MGLMERTKGHNFERKIAAELRALWPGADVHRSSQAERARNPDVMLEGNVPELAKLLWLELQDARVPTPAAKLVQAEADIAALAPSRAPCLRLPVVVWHRIRERSMSVTTPLWVLDVLRGHWKRDHDHTGDHHAHSSDDASVTTSWGQFLELLRSLPMPTPTAKEAA